jgi:hypothetical protein
MCSWCTASGKSVAVRLTKFTSCFFLRPEGAGALSERDVSAMVAAVAASLSPAFRA